MESAFYKQTTLPGFSLEKEETPVLPGQIGPYQIESLLSKGGMSHLYLGLDPKTKETLVIKVLSPQFVSHPEALERFLKEAQVITLASHPNIVKLHGEGKWEGGLYLALEFIRGISLRQFILQHSLSLKRGLEIVLQVAYALCHLHTHGVIHRDLKPENILITEEGEVKVIDFGIAQLHEVQEDKKQTGEEGLLGTPHYMSPEQKEIPSRATFASDIYSLGVIAYELSLGKLSFGVINLSLLPMNLRKILQKALAPSLKERYGDIVDFITDLTSYLHSKELEKERPGSDQLQELLEELHLTELSLSSRQLLETASFEAGLAKKKEIGEAGYYFDLFSLPENLFAVVLVKQHDKTLAGSLFLAKASGMIELQMHLQKQTRAPFAVSSFLSMLNEMALLHFKEHPFGLALLVLSPRSEELVFASFQEGSLFHLPQGSATLREHLSDNPSLESTLQREFSLATDNWNIGDLLILSSFGRDQNAENKALLSRSILSSSTLSITKQAEEILCTLTSFQKENFFSPQLVLTLRRIG